MTSSAQPSAARFTGTIPELYDRQLGPIVLEPYAEDLARRFASLGAHATLELAAGTGILTRRLLEVLPAAGSLVATDLNQAMLDIAATRLTSVPWLELRVADAQSLPFADHAFDAVVCQFGVMFFPDKPLAMREARRVLKPGGTLLFNVWDAFTRNAFARIAHEALAACFPADPPQFYLTPFGWHDEAVIRGVVEGAGFRDVQIEAVGKEASAESAKQFAIGLVRGNPVLPTAQKGGDTDTERVIEVVATGLAKAWGEAPCRGPMRALVVTATA